MGLLIKIFPYVLPAFLRKRILVELFTATADAFNCPAPDVKHLSYEDCLRTYAVFTREESEKTLLEERDIEAVKTRLFQNAYPLGEKLRKWTGARTLGDVMDLGQILYKAIGVEIESDPQGDVTVRHCYYSQFYSAQGCALISSLDEGVFSGLSGGCKLTFSERITQGEPYCKAKLMMAEKV